MSRHSEWGARPSYHQASSSSSLVVARLPA
jgi:hypothetical protein